MKNQIKFTGNRNYVDQSEDNRVTVIGDGNDVRYKTRDIYIDQRRTEIRTDAAKTGGQTGGEFAIGSVFISLFAGWLYVRHFYAAIEHLQDGILLSAAPAVLTLLLVAVRAISNDEDIPSVQTKEFLIACLSPVVAGGLVWLTNITAGTLPDEIIAAAQELTAKDFWQHLSEAQRTILWQNVIAIVAIGMGGCLNFLMSIHCFADELLARANRRFAARIFGFTYKYRPQRSLFLQLFLITCVYLALSGKGLDLFHQLLDFAHNPLS